MPISVTWDTPDQSVIRWDVTGDWTWDEVAQAAQQSITMREELAVDESASILVYVQSAAPIKSDTFHQLRKTLLINPARRDLVVVVGKTAYIEVVVEIFRKMYMDMAEAIISAESVHSARRIIERHRERP